MNSDDGEIVRLWAVVSMQEALPGRLLKIRTTITQGTKEQRGWVNSPNRKYYRHVSPKDSKQASGSVSYRSDLPASITAS